MFGSPRFGARVAWGVLFELEHDHRLRELLGRQRAGYIFDRAELVEGRAAAEAITHLHALRGDVERSSGALQEVRQRVTLTFVQIVFDHVRRRVTIDGCTVGKT